MTNTNPKHSKAEQFTPALTMPETGEHPFDRKEEVQTTPKGTDFAIKQDNSGLYIIKMIKSGGKVPIVCEEKFTSFVRARLALSSYIASKE